NLNALPDATDIVVALDRLQAMVPAVESVSLVVAWFGDDLRAGSCKVRPGVEVSAKSTTPLSWLVNGVSRANAFLVSRDDQDRPVYGGTPSDFAVVQAIQEMKARGLRVTFYPFILMDVPPGNTLPNPYSDNTTETGQPAFPWRGRITCSPAAGYVGSVDKTATAATQVSAFFGAATPAQFAISGDTVTWTGSSGDWGLRRMILHYAHLCAVAGGVDAFLIGTEMRGLTTIRSGASAYPAVTAFKALAADVKAILGPGTKVGYASDWSEYFGHQPGDGSGDVFFHLDPLWSDANIDFIGIDNYMPLSDWRDGFDHLDAADGWPAIYDRAYLQANIAGGEGFDWFYASAADRSAQIRTPITDGGEAGNATGPSDPPNGKPWVFRYKDLRAWWSNPHFNRPGGVESGTPTAWVPQSKPVWFTELGCPSIDRGTNQPNVFFDPKSSESFTPYFSRGWRDDAIQRAYLEASYLWWGQGANNPTSSVYGGRMVHVPECAAWTWDARPYPFFPELTGVWTDGPNWRLGHWLTGRLGAVSLAALVRHLCLRAGLDEALIDVSGLWGAVEGYVIGALESPRASISTLARHFGFDAIETEGVIRFVMRGRASVATLAIDDLVASREGEAFELTRGQETELPQALKWQVARADEDYDAALVEARRITVDTTRIASESFPMAIPPEEAERRCRRALMEAWIGRESATFRLPPSRLALDPADVVMLAHDGRAVPLRLISIADADARGVEAVRQDREAYDLPPGAPRPSALSQAVVFGAPEAVLLDLPQLTEDQPPHRPFAAAHAVPWPGEIAVFRSPSTDGFELLTSFGTRARIGALVSDFYAGPTSRFDLGNALVVHLLTGTLESVTDLTLFGGANALAIESAPGVWEIVQAGAAELLAPGRYRLTRLLRGQRGTEGAMGNPAPAGARAVVLDDSLASLPIAEADIGIPWNWRIGPASRPVSDETYVAQSFTPQAVGLRPFSVVHVEQPWRKPRTPGDLTIRWTRRSRALSADSWGGLEVPLGEELEAYEVEILDGATVKRVLNTTTTSAIYTAAQQTADWGAPLGPSDTLDLRISQLSALVGRGAPKTVTLLF
ncbi:MAG: glycoside hydrolase TIM-barrel-like domain-containing protein, partial [Tabrizicola sp.]